jgi:hypothetical protein
MDCIHSFFQGKRDLPFALGTFPSFVVLTTPNNQPVAKATQPDKLKRWGEMSLKHMCAGSAGGSGFGTSVKTIHFLAGLQPKTDAPERSATTFRKLSSRLCPKLGYMLLFFVMA